MRTPELKFSKMPCALFVGTSKPLFNLYIVYCVLNRCVKIRRVVQAVLFGAHLVLEVADATGNVKSVIRHLSSVRVCGPLKTPKRQVCPPNLCFGGLPPKNGLTNSNSILEGRTNHVTKKKDRILIKDLMQL